MSKTTILLVACLLPACAALSNSPHTSENGGGVGEGASDNGDDASPLAVASKFSLISNFSITSGALAPEPAYELLSDLDSDPGRALISLADAAGVPAAERLFDALPSSLSNRIGEWMTEAIGDDGNAEFQTLMAWTRVVLADVEVHSSLEIGALDAEGNAVASHTLTSLGFHFGDEVVEEDIPQIDSLPGAGHAELTVSSAADAEGRTVRFGEHRFGLLFGDAAYRAFESRVQSQFGTNVRGLLAEAIDCPSVAESVANRCVLGVCVGHTADLVGLCDGALDRAAQEIRDQFTVFDAEILRLQSGEARVIPTADGSELQSGRWVAEAELGQGLRELPASFVGASY